jgi:hypothetical protein
MASTAMPETNQSALKWCEYLFQAQGTLRMAYERIFAYFLTDVEIGALTASDPLGEDEKDKWENFLRDDFSYLSAVHQLNRDKGCYGNGFATITNTFRRFLKCPHCPNLFTLKEVFGRPNFKFKWYNFEFTAKCPTCKYSGAFRVKDEPDKSPEKLKIKRWSPHEIHLLHCPLTDDVHYLWQIPDDYKNQVKQGRLFHLERVSEPILKAIKNNQAFRFAPNAMYHMKEPTLAGVRNRGWGISRLITNFRQAWYVQVLHRFNEAIALDYVIPFRLITPAARSGAGNAKLGDPLLSGNMSNFNGQVRQMLAKRRRDPASWNTLGFPVEYQALGGDARSLAPHELLDQGQTTLLDSIGVPVDLYKGNLQMQTAPVAMRQFEATFYHMVQDNNQFLRWAVERVSEILSWEAIDARHKRVTHADDMQRSMAILQLMMGQVISMTSGLKAMGIDYKDEQRLISEEARFQQEQQADVQEEMEQTAYGEQIAAGQPSGGGAPGQPMDPAAAGGAPPGGGQVDPATGQPIAAPVTDMIQSANVPTTPEDMMAQAESLAQQLLGLPEGQKDSELHALKDKNEVLHALVLAKIREIRQGAASQGGQQLMQQQFGGGGAGAPGGMM